MDKRECSGDPAFLRSDSESSRLSSAGVVELEAGGGAMLPELHAGGRVIAANPDSCALFQPGWRDISATIPRKMEANGEGSHMDRGKVNEQCQGQGPGQGLSATIDRARVAKSFNEALAEYFDVDGRKSSIELQLNSRAPCTRRGPPSSSSEFRGVTRHRRTRKWESHIWYNKKQLYLGGFKGATDAAKAHDIMGLKLKKGQAHTNFEPLGYASLMRYLDELSMECVMEALRMCSKGGGPNRMGHRSRNGPKNAALNMRRFREQEVFSSQVMGPPASHDLDLESTFPQSSGVSEVIHATLLPRTWNGDPRNAGARIPGGLQNDHRLPVLSSMNDYMPLPGNMTGSCEVIDGSQGGLFCKTEGGTSCNTLSPLSAHHGDIFAMDIQNNGCIGHHSYKAQGHQTQLGQPAEDKSQIFLTIPQTNSDQYMMPMARRLDGGTLPHMDSGFQDLFVGGCAPEKRAVSIAEDTTLVPSGEAVIVKVPVVPSKVIRYPQVSPTIPAFGSHLQLSSPVSVPISSHEAPRDSTMQYMQIISEASNPSGEVARQHNEEYTGNHAKLLPVHPGENTGAVAVGIQCGKSRSTSCETGESASMGEEGY